MSPSFPILGDGHLDYFEAMIYIGMIVWGLLLLINFCRRHLSLSFLSWGLTRVECTQCGDVEYLEKVDITRGVLYFCSSRCQSDYHYQLDPTNYVREEEG